MEKLSTISRNVLEAFAGHLPHQEQITQDLIVALASGIEALADTIDNDEPEPCIECGASSCDRVIDVDDLFEVASELENYRV